MSKYIKEKKKTKEMLYYEILTDPFFIPEAKVLLMYLLEIKHGYLNETVEIDDEAVMNELHFTKYKWSRAKKQLKEIGLIK